jgi:hypothetical protein
LIHEPYVSIGIFSVIVLSPHPARPEGIEMSKDMKISRLTLKNWKNFANAEVGIQNRVFLVGPNASGKSNFLDVFRFLKDLSSSGGGFQESVASHRGGVTAIRCLAARRYPDVEIHVELKDRDDTSQWEYEIAFSQDKQRRPVLRKEIVRHVTMRCSLCVPNDDDRSDPARLTQTYLEQVNVNKPFRDLTTFFSSVRYLHIVPQLVREPGPLRRSLQRSLRRRFPGADRKSS